MIEFDPKRATSQASETAPVEAIDPTLQNFTRALAQAIELQGRYRVFQFEALQDGQARTADTFEQLRETHARQISALRAGLTRRFDALADEGRGT